MFKGFISKIKLALREVLDERDNNLKPVDISVDLMRELLGTKSFSRDVRPMDGEARKNYVARIAASWPDLDKDTDLMIAVQEQNMGRRVNNQDELMFGRGTINGIMLIKDYYEDRYNEHKANTKPEEKFDPSKLFPTVAEEEEVLK